MSPLELLLRGTVMYWLLFVVLRFVSCGATWARWASATSCSWSRLCLVRDGKLLRKNMRREFITDEEVNAKIRHEGVEDLATVKRMYLEADGEMSVIRNDAPTSAA